MSGDDEDPILKAAPPETDHITYLTILEYQLTEARLPSLFKVLQDDAITEGIGWDLVHILAPMLPASQSCLDLIARKGNPREVIIRVTEYLSSLSEGLEDDDLKTFEGEAERIHLGEMTLDGMPRNDPHRDQSNVDDIEKAASTRASDIVQFEALLTMLSVVHPRIKTKVPSRFLATSLPAALTAYRRNIDDQTTLIFIDFVSKLSGRRRPALPPRDPSSASQKTTNVSLPDPEAEVSTALVSPDEKALIQRLLQAVALEICEDYVSSLGGDVAGMVWSSRVRESIQPEKEIPGRRTVTEQYQTETFLKNRDTIMMRIMVSGDHYVLQNLTFGQDLCLLLGLHPKAILESLVPNSQDEFSQAAPRDPESPKEFPTKPTDISFSTTGSMVYLAAYQTASRLGIDKRFPFFRIELLPTISRLNGLFTLDRSIADNDDVVIDALIAINLMALVDEESLKVAPPLESFYKYLEPLAFLSADSPDPQWRYNSHVVVGTVVAKHPDEKVQLGIIENFLRLPEHGPRSLLRGSAIGWLKDRISDAQRRRDGTGSHTSSSFFLDGSIIENIAPLIFWDFDEQVDGLDCDISNGAIAMTLSNIISVLNFYYFMMTNQGIRTSHQPGMAEAPTEAYSSVTDQVAQNFMDRVRGMVKRLNELDDDIKEGMQGDLMIIKMCLQSIDGR